MQKIPLTSGSLAVVDIELARESAAKAQVNPLVAKMILSGHYDSWPNVQGALNAIRAVRATSRGMR